MRTLTAAELRARFLDYFQGNGHAILPSASLIPEGDPTVLFTTAGMQPLVPYLLGQSHPLGRRLANAQKCLRTDDIEAVGDAFHLTFFEMLGNWSLGDYFKEQAIAMSFEFLVSDRWLGVPRDKLVVTCFAGDADAPRDTESAAIWGTLGIPEERVLFFGRKENWWGPLGKTGPCGPDTEIFFDTGLLGRAPNDGTERFVEIWNNVFMQYRQTEAGTFEDLPQKNVDTGMGLERTVAALNRVPSVYDTDLFAPIIGVLRDGVGDAETRALRIAADHLRAAVFVLADTRGIVPSNEERGYVVRRLIRRGLRALEVLAANEEVLDGTIHRVLDRFVKEMANTYGHWYTEVRERAIQVTEQLRREQLTYRSVRLRAGKELQRRRERGETNIQGREAFELYQSRGFHPDLIRSLGDRLGITVDLAGFEEEFAKHQAVSQAGSAQRFAGGLVDHGERTVRLHTATHLLHEALRRVLGPHVRQKGSNITAQRLRFDFSHPQKLTAAEIRKIEDLVNEQIHRDLPVTSAVMTPAEAKAVGALGFFEEKYGERVSVYTVGEFSKEVCGGPHVARTGQVGRFHILRDEALAAGVRRIRAVVEDAKSA